MRYTRHTTQHGGRTTPTPSQSLSRSPRERHEAEADRAAEKATGAREAGAAQGLSSLSSQGGGTGAGVTPGGGGRPLSPAERASFEPSFGRDFSGVRVHADAEAAQAADDASANAFTVGNHIVFGAGRFKPETPQGRQLLAHELAHTVQQQGAAASGDGVMQRQPKEEKKGIGSAPPSDDFKVAEGVAPEDEHFLFDKDSANLSPGATESLLAKIATYTAPVTVEIHGYASGEGDPAYNSNLSAHRAVALKSLIASKLPPGSKVVLYARGETGKFGALENNRRAGLKITQGSDASPAINETTLDNEAWKLTLPPLGAPPSGSSIFGNKYKLTPPLLTPPFSTQTPTPNLFPTSTVKPLPGLGGPLAGPQAQVQPFLNIPPALGQGVIDWSAVGEPFRSRGLSLSGRDGDSVLQTWTGTYRFLLNLGFSPKIAASISDIGTAKAYDNLLSREHPTALDKMNAEWDMYLKVQHPDALNIPPIPIITPTTLNWLGKKLFKKDINFNF